MAADLVIKGGWVVTPDATFKGGVAISKEVIVAIGADDSLPDGKEVIDVKGKHILPGLFDGHVHFREPGMTHKEDFNTGSTAAVCGGITTVVDMPNTVPPTADAEQVKVKKELGEAKSLVDFGITGVVVQTNTKDILPMAAAGAIGYKIFFGETIGNLPFPDDGMCMEAFDYIAQSKLPLGIHAENRQIMAYCTNKLKTEGKNDARYWEASRPDICEAESVHHAIFFAETFGTKLHVFHMSSKQAAYMVRDAKARGLRITAETGPHYLLREPNDMDNVGSLLKMNPPVRTKDHAEVLWQGLREGFVDTLATDHSPHTLDEKRFRYLWQTHQAGDLGLHLWLLRRRDRRAVDIDRGQQRPSDAQSIRQMCVGKPRQSLAGLPEKRRHSAGFRRRHHRRRHGQGRHH